MRSESLVIVNYKRATAAAGASIAALLIIGAATFLCFIATFNMSPFASGPGAGGKLLWFTLLPAASAASMVLIAKSSGFTSLWRMILSTMVACALAIVWVASGPAASPNSSTAEELSVHFALLWASASYTMIATVRRPEIRRGKKLGIYSLCAVAYVAGLILINADFGGLSLLASIVAWILLPTAAASINPRHQNPDG
jgi:hypothetical protein